MCRLNSLKNGPTLTPEKLAGLDVAVAKEILSPIEEVIVSFCGNYPSNLPKRDRPKSAHLHLQG
jgi:hypothetical protein